MARFIKSDSVKRAAERIRKRCKQDVKGRLNLASGKRAFGSKREAEEFIVTQCGSRLYTYKCKDCKRWHLSKSPPRKPI